MTSPVPPAHAGSSTRPYLIRALHDWCTDNGFTPYIAVFVDAGVQVPTEYVKNNEIVLNIGFETTTALKLGNEHIEFKARFGGVSREIIVPVDHVIAIYARENGQGMAFPVPTDAPAGHTTLVPAGGGETAGAGAGALAAKGPKLSLAEGPAAAPEPRGERSDEPPADPPSGGRPTLKRIK